MARMPKSMKDMLKVFRDFFCPSNKNEQKPHSKTNKSHIKRREDMLDFVDIRGMRGYNKHKNVFILPG